MHELNLKKKKSTLPEIFPYGVSSILVITALRNRSGKSTRHHNKTNKTK